MRFKNKINKNPKKNFSSDFKKKKINLIEKNIKKNILKENLIVGVFSKGKGDFGFIDVEGLDKGYFVFGKNNFGALSGDKVEAFVKEYKGRKEAEVIKIIERSKNLLVGEYIPSKNNRYGFVKVRNNILNNDIFIPGKKSLEAKAGDIVGVLVNSWDGKNPEGTIKEIIGKKSDKKIDILSLIIEGGAKLKFSESVLKYADKIKIQSKDYENRKDLTKLFTFTIDGEDAKDLDDAISIEKLDIGGYKLYVHIADVAHFVTEKSPIDIDAYSRATSIYLVDRVIPMLPEKLSNDLCSLNPLEKKLTLTCEMIIGNNGKIKETRVYESFIKSDFRLTYKEVDEILENKIKLNTKLLFGNTFNKELKQKIFLCNELKQKITNYRKNVGVLNFDFPETQIILDDDGNPVSIKEYPRYNSNKIIEEFMISANEAVSREFSDIPFLYRVHDEPKDDDIEKLQDILNIFGIDFHFKNNTTKEFSELLEKISKLDNSKRTFLEKIVLKTFSKAVYSKENFGHFGLGLSFYSHFTSPIRRYPDLQIHRIIKEKINKKLDKERISKYKEKLEEVANYTSSRERKAEKLEYKIRDYFIVKYYKNKIGEDFEAIISGVIPKGFFVSLKDTSEGFVELNNSDFREELLEHIDLKTGNKYRLGDKIKVKLIEADEILLRLNFEII